MATKPTTGHLDWITDDAPAKFTQPSPAKQLAGWIKTEKPPFQYFNWAWRVIDRWLKYLETATDESIAAIGTEATDRANADSAHAALTSPHSATSAATADRLMIRDANGRVKAAAPGEPDDVARQAEITAHAALISHVPVGGILFSFSPTPFPGTIAIIGQELVRATYADLWAYANASGNIVDDTTWLAERAAGGCGKFSTGDGSTTFRLPEPRGEYLRIWDNGRGIDAGRLFGEWKDGEVGRHRHSAVVWGVNIQGGSYFHRGTGSPLGNAYTEYTGSGENRVRDIPLLMCMKY